MAKIRKVPDYLACVLEGSAGYPSLPVILLLALVINIRPTIDLYTQVFPRIRNLENNIISLIVQTIPENTEISLKDGSVSSNMAEPFYISINKDLAEQILNGKVISTSRGVSKIRALTIDTKGRAEDFDRYQSLALLTQNSLVYYNDGKINIYPLKNTADFTISRSFLLDKVRSWNKNNLVTNTISIMVIILPIILFTGYFISQIFIFAILTVMVMLMSYINNIRLKFIPAYRFTTLVAIIPLLCWQICDFAFRTSYDVVLMIILSAAYLYIRSRNSNI
jgi:hypothetical protein